MAVDDTAPRAQRPGPIALADLFDAALNYKIAKGTDLALNVSNLFDEQHVVGSGTADYYNPGREVTAKLSYSW